MTFAWKPRDIEIILTLRTFQLDQIKRGFVCGMGGTAVASALLVSPTNLVEMGKDCVDSERL